MPDEYVRDIIDDRKLIMRNYYLLFDASNRAQEVRQVDAMLTYHQCFLQIKAQTCIRVYMDPAFEGNYDTRPLSLDQHTLLQYVRSEDINDNAADTELIWDVALLTLMADSTRRKISIGVLTADKGFRTIKSLVESRGHKLEFLLDAKKVVGWVEQQKTPSK